MACSQLGLAGPIVWHLVAADSASRRLTAFKTWLMAHQHAVDQAVLFGFDAILTPTGLTGLT